ncbi:MAG: GLUG motif-containing protein [Nanoarchaeota archaeon]|nr:GLUG motif-containing protein [Nanoarchaeota archaeon]
MTAANVFGLTAIHDCIELQNMQDNLYEDYYLVNDIDCSDTVTWNSGEGFNPVGNSTTIGFRGSMDGNYHVVQGLYINRPSTNRIGLFGQGYDIQIQNIGIVGAQITGSQEVGALIGFISASSSDSTEISNSYSTGTIDGVWYVGGLIGYAQAPSRRAEIHDCYSTADITGVLEGLGGLIGQAGIAPMLNINDSYATGTVYATNDNPVSDPTIGGFVGKLRGANITNCYSVGGVDYNK